MIYYLLMLCIIFRGKDIKGIMPNQIEKNLKKLCSRTVLEEMLHSLGALAQASGNAGTN